MAIDHTNSGIRSGFILLGFMLIVVVIKFTAPRIEDRVRYVLHTGACGSVRRCATSRTVPGSIPGGVTGDFFHGTPDRTMCHEVDSASESEYQGFLLE